MRIKPTISKVKAVSLSVFLGLLTFSATTTSTFAQASVLSGRPDPVNWVIGPSKADLGENAQIEVPAGFRFVGPQDARTLLLLMNNPAPETLAGILTPNSGGYIVIFESSTVGYINDSKEKLDADSILKELQKKVDRQNAQAGQAAQIASLEWDMEPQYDRSTHVLEWSIHAQTGASSAVNHVVRRLGRETMLDAIAVQSGGVNQEVPLKQIMTYVSFKSGHSYADYQKGDQLAKVSLAEAISMEPGSAKAAQPKWAYIVGGASLFALGSGLLAFKRKPRTSKAPAYLKTSVNGHAPKLTNGSLARANGHSNGHLNGKAKHRRRSFDYQKYYSDLMFQVSDRAYETLVVQKPKESRTATVKAATNGHASTDNVSLAANLSLIESQKRLIEEQQRLIREQTKLIEEKTKLIQEKNQVLDKQSELFGNNVF